MAKFMESASDIKKSVKKPKKKKEETVKKAQSPSVSNKAQTTVNRLSQKYSGGSTRQQTVKRPAKGSASASQNVSQQTQRTVDRLNAKYGQNRTINNTQQNAKQRQERTRQAQRQKMGYNSMASKETQETVNRAVKNTPSLVKKAVKDTVSGHLQTMADITEVTASNENGTKAKAMKMGIDLNDKKQMDEVKRERQKTVEQAKLDREKWAKQQDERQQAWDKKVNGATGAEKAYYGAVESGTGMLTDLAIGLGTQGGSLAAMFSRTYGSTRGQAQKEGATEAEDRTYAFLQAAKEVGTELMFPGAGLAGRAYGKKAALPLAERVANNETKRIASRTAADLTGAGVRLLGGTAEENLEEVAGFGLDPLIKEFSYGRNVRTRQKVADLQNESDQLRANIKSDEDARRVASYLSSSEWLEQNKAQYKEAGLSEKQAQEVAEKMRDYMTASLTGDTETMDMLEQDIASTLSKGEFSYTKSLDKSELLDTLASTTLLTLTTGLPGTATTAMRGSVIRDNLGEDGIRTLAESAMNYEDEEASKRGEVARDRLNAGQELTATQVYELAASQAQQVEKDTRRVVAKNAVVADTLESEKLVAPMIMRDEQGNIHGDSIITQRYNESAQEAENVLKDIGKDQKLSLSNSELAVGSRAIAGFQTGAFTINDANALNYTNTAVRDAFEKVTGVDLGQYVVKTSTGAVDYAATNAATKDALFTMAADNYIETARAETENFKDITKGITAEQMAQRIGSEGDLAISTALDTVDPADEDTYGLMASAAQNVYEYGRFTEDSWDDVSGRLGEMYPGLSQETLQDVYEAAKRDKTIAETPYYNAKITANESVNKMDMSEAEQAEYGKFTNDTGEDIGMKERAVLESLAREFNINIRLLPSEFFEYKYVDRNGKEKTAYSNGSYDPKTGTMLLNGGNDMDRNLIAVALHETTHHIATYAPDEYLALSNRVMETWYKNDRDAFNAAIKRKQDSYKAQVKQNLSEEQALEEVIADAMGEMASDPDFISQICTEEPSLAEQIIKAIKSVLRKLRAVLASGNVAEEYEDAFFNQLGIWDDAQRLWLQAAKVAQQVRANQMIDEWDANARMTVEEQTEALANEIESERLSIVEDEELIRQLDADSHINTYRAMALIDGKLYPPMATKVKDEKGKWQLQQGMDIGQWVESDITTDSRMFDKDGKFHLKKDDGSDVYAAYNPYIHSSDSMLNDQFATAYKRPNIVVVEGEIPESELTSGYRAEHDLDDGRHVVAKDTTGITDWKAGIVQGQLSGKRTVYLTQHFKPVRIVPDTEVAEHIRDKVAGTDIAIPYNVVTPSVRDELLNLGVKMKQSKEEKYYVEGVAQVRFSIEEAEEKLEENFNEYKEDKENLRIAAEALKDLQDVRFSVAENTSNISGRWSRNVQVRTIGKGITADLVNEGYIEFRGRKVKSPEDLAKLCQVLRDPRFETFRVVLTKGDKIVSFRSISSRLPGLSQAFESADLSDGIDIVRDRMKRTGADGYYLIHNHPSGNVTASFADLSVTRAYLALLGQDTYKGHIILDHDKYGFIDADVPQVIRGENFPTAREESITGQQTFDLIHEPEIDHPLLGEAIHGHNDVAKCGQFVNASDDVSVLIYTNSPGEVTGIQEISNKTLKSNKEIAGFIKNQAVEFGAAGVFLYTTDIETYQTSKNMVESGHLVDSVVAYGNNKQWSESAREVVSPRADVEVLGQVHDDVIRRTHVFESATGATEYRYSLPETDNEGKALTQDQREFFRDVAPELLDDNGNIKRYFHGTARADRVGYYFNPERATSGPMAYFTDNRDIATNYSRDKADTSLAYEGEDVNDYHNQFVVDVDGEEVRLEDYWYQLPANKRIEYRERAGHITYDYDGEDDTALIIDENVSNGNGGYGADPYLVRQARGNAFRMLIDAWLDSGDFFNEEERFLEVMDLLGMEGVRYKDPNYRDEKVYEVYLNVTNPIVTTDLDEEFAADVEDWLDATDLDYYARESASADMWDKNDRDPYDWLDALRDDIENGTTHVWTSIPDVITDFLKEQGYDGIVDQGGKYHEAGHQVVIPFEPNQIKSVTNEHPTEDVDIRYSITPEMDAEYMEAVNSGNMEQAQRLVDDAALTAGYTTKAYHGTGANFTVFDPERSGKNYQGFSKYGKGLYFSSSEEKADEWGKHRKVLATYLNFEKPYKISLFAKDGPLLDEYNRIRKEQNPRLKPSEGEPEGFLIEMLNGMTGDSGYSTEFLQGLGYDGIIAEHEGSTGYPAWTEYVAFEPTQIKSSDSVTYAEDGSVIPLSERFNPDNNDIRYSLPTQDSDGNILSDGQMEYFKNSQARDEQGRLVRVYHGTASGPRIRIFTGDTGFFFSDNVEVSEEYATKDDYDIPGSMLPEDRDPYESDEEYLTRMGFKFEEDDGEWIAKRTSYDGYGEYEYDDTADSKEELMEMILSSAEANDLEDSPFELRNTYSAYLNLINPYIIECNESTWDDINDTGMTTRDVVEEAMSEGYDGVIFKDIYDSYNLSNVYVAFSSNQIKDTRNTDPSENPDIRYSIVDDDEAVSQMAYDDAVDNSYEALAYYETLIDEPEEQIEIYAESFDEEKINEFYAGLNSYKDYVVFEDPVLEEGRKRMARSRDDYMERLNAEWNEKWLTEGEILDLRSVKKDVREMVKSIMRNADTPNKVKNDIVNKTLIDIRLAYQFAKKGRIDVADALLWHTSMRMIEGVEFVNDDTFNEYKDLRDYLRTTRIQLGEEYWSDVDYQAFRKNNFGRMKLVKGETNVDEIYQEMCERWPEWFDEEEEMTPPDQLLQIEHVLDVIQPYKEAYSSEEAASIATDIAYDLSDIVYGKGKPYESIADKYKNRYDKQTQAMRQRHEEALRKVKEQRDKALKANKELKAVNRQNLKEQRTKYEAKTRSLKEKHREDLRFAREEAREKGQERERARWEAKETKRKERQIHKKYFDRIVKNYNWLAERLLTNTKDKHIPEQYKKELAELLGAFDLQTVRSKKLEIKNGLYYRTDYKSQKTIKMEAMKKAINNIEAKSEFFHLNDSITDIIDELLGREGDGSYNKAMSIEGKTIDELSVDELKKIDNLLKALKHEFTFYESVRTGAKRTQAADIGTAQVDSALKHAELFGPGKDYNNILGAADKILNMDEMTPTYLFKRIDPKNTGLGMMFRELRRSFDKYVKNQEQLNGWMEEILSPYHSGGKMWKKYGAEEIENWRRSKATNTFKLQNGDEIRLTPAQMMSVYCLAKRPQAYQHMVGAGIVVKPVTFQAKLETDLKRKTNWALPTILTDGDIKMISTALTPDQKKVADQLQQLMATKMAAWGNEASRAVIGIDLFEDPDYFPIQSDKAALEEDFTADQFVDMIRNFGFAKAVQPGARNAIAIDDIFTVVSTHCNNMNLYNAYSESMNDFMKVYNYHALREDGSDYSVKQAIAHAYSQKATTFISTFMRDLNGNVSKGRVTGIDNMMNAALGNAKKASVFANGRVALQQPTAIVRAFSVISPKYMKGIKIERGAMQEMFEHCPIALWKSWGYYDINMGKSVEDIMMNNGNWLEDKMTDIYGAADNVTWTAIWQMCKSEVKDKNPKVKEGSDEFWDLVNERMTEVVDLTQVVDSPFHRSHAMRDKQILVKMATSFMAEPTLTFNMVRDGLVNSFEMYKLGDKAGAARLLGKTSRVFALSAFATAAAAAIWDAVRGKQPDGDDDDDGTAIGLWWANTLANFQDNLKLWNNIYYIKDIASLFDGWGTSNLALQGWKQLADGYAQLTGAYRVNSKKAWWENMLAGIGYLSGTPYGTILKDGKALLNIFGIHPSFLSAIGEQLDSVQDMLGGSSAGSGVSKTSTNNESNNKKAGSDESDATSAAVKLWTYDNAPFKVEDGSPVDKFLNRFGVNLTAAEIAAVDAQIAEKEHQERVDKIKESLSEYSGEEYDKHLWDKSDMEGYGKAIADGDFKKAEEIEQMFIDCGGSQKFIDEKKLYHYNKNYIKTITYDPTDEQIERQQEMRDFLLSHGVTESELSAKVYKSNTCKELKVAFRLNDKDAILEELVPLIRAGITYDDFVKAYDNRNRVDLKKYKDSDGKYAERLKSTGVYNWPITGQITSNFGHRSSPGGIGSTNHQGLDIAGNMGDPVGAADGGTVVYAGWYGGAGKTVMIEHDDGTITQYSHLSWWDAKVGDTVAQGQTIGKVGSTGNSTGPHLHFGVKVNGSYVDPLTYLN